MISSAHFSRLKKQPTVTFTSSEKIVNNNCSLITDPGTVGISSVSGISHFPDLIIALVEYFEIFFEASSLNSQYSNATFKTSPVSNGISFTVIEPCSILLISIPNLKKNGEYFETVLASMNTFTFVLSPRIIVDKVLSNLLISSLNSCSPVILINSS